MRIFISLLIAFLTSSFSHAASFNCNKASTKNEIAICSDPELSTLDEVLAATYKQTRGIVSDANNLKNEQINWIKSIATCDGNTDCLIGAYRDRIRVLDYVDGRLSVLDDPLKERISQLNAREEQLDVRERNLNARVAKLDEEAKLVAPKKQKKAIKSNQNNNSEISVSSDSEPTIPVSTDYEIKEFLLTDESRFGARDDLEWCAGYDWFNSYSNGFPFYFLNDFMFIAVGEDIYPIARFKDGWFAPNCEISVDGDILTHRTMYDFNTDPAANKWQLLPLRGFYNPEAMVNVDANTLYAKLEEIYAENVARVEENKQKAREEEAKQIAYEKKFKEMCLDWEGVKLPDRAKQSFSELYSTPWRDIELIRVEYESILECNFILDTSDGIKTFNAVEAIRSTM
jgi:uncharacterized protein